MADQATQTFDRFEELPMELQIEVWKMAFDAEDPFRLRNKIEQYWDSGRHVLFSSPKLYEAIEFTPIGGMGQRVQVSVMRVCRISRLVSLQRWYNIVMKVNVSAPGEYWTNEWDANFRDATLRVFGALIEELKNRMEGN